MLKKWNRGVRTRFIWLGTSAGSFERGAEPSISVTYEVCFDYYSKTCLKRNAIVPLFFFRFYRFPFYKGLCFNKTKYKKYDRLGLQ
jgi:hypothetical protein